MEGYVLHSTNLFIRLVQQSDLSDIHTLHSLPETDEYNTLGIPNDLDETKSIVNEMVQNNKKMAKTNLTFAIELKNSRQFIGLLGLKLGAVKYKSGEIWYKLNSQFWNKGYATEAVKQIIIFGFDNINLHRIEAGCAIQNIGSIRVLEKAGMIKEGRKRKVLPLKSGWTDNYEYAILDSDRKDK